jgi:hypothetical protein
MVDMRAQERGWGGLRVRLPLIRSELLNYWIVLGGWKSVSLPGHFIFSVDGRNGLEVGCWVI